jgi:uncharacterized protein YydD (DUF2326 family)
MIVSIESSIATFKTVRFHAGLNVLLADTQPGATDKQTRNSAGKTSLIEIIHFLLGAKCAKDSLFRTVALLEHSFTGTFVVGGVTMTVQRSGNAPARIFLLAGSENVPGLVTKAEKATGRVYVSNENWKAYLGRKMFSLPEIARDSDDEQSGTLSFRSLIAYFARRREAGAFFKPVQQAQMQQRSDWQTNLSYILGLDWEIPLEFQNVRDKEKNLDELKKASQAGALGEVIGTVAVLRPQVTIAEANAQKLREQLSNFEVLDSYKDLSDRAARARTDMQALGREAVSLKESLQHLLSALSVELPPERSDLQQMYEAAGVELPEVALRRFDEVNRFYSSVVENRRSHLQAQITQIESEIAQGELRMGSLDVERRDIMTTLQGRGALEDFVRLQGNLATLDAQAAALRERFKAAEALEGQSTQLHIDRSNLKRRLQKDFHDRQLILDRAILIIAETIAELYDDRTGRFVVEATENGPEFNISIEGDRGGGISSMEIFCFDLTLFKIASQRFGGTGFLIHDSHLFDGVDERQVARALLLGQRAAGSGQYIVTMNSDIFDKLPLPSKFDRSKIIVSTRLSDETETGGLFGFRFD